MERFGVNASKSRSEVTPREWFETYGSKPELRGPHKRRHFAAITKVAETRPSQPCAASIFQQQKNAGFQRVSFKTLWARVGGEPTVLTLDPVGRCGRRAHGFDLGAGWPVWAGAHDFNLEVEFKSGQKIDRHPFK
jgi:hypothetical protein